MACQYRVKKEKWTQFIKSIGVVSDRLKALAKSPPILLPDNVEPNKVAGKKKRTVFGAEYKALDTQAELTATGMDSLRGVLLVNVPGESPMSRYGFESDDVVLKLDGKKIASKQFSKTIKGLSAGEHRVTVWRGQQQKRFEFKVEN